MVDLNFGNMAVLRSQGNVQDAIARMALVSTMLTRP